MLTLLTQRYAYVLCLFCCAVQNVVVLTCETNAQKRIKHKDQVRSRCIFHLLPLFISSVCSSIKISEYVDLPQAQTLFFFLIAKTHREHFIKLNIVKKVS